MKEGSRDSRQAIRLALIGLILLGFALRVIGLDAQPLRGDESFSMVVWLVDIRRMFGDLATVDPQPPLALISLWAWTRLVGESAFAARMLAALASTVSIGILYALGRRLGGQAAGLIAAALWAVHPWQIWFAQDLRSTALWTALSAGALLAFLTALEEPARHRCWIAWALLSAAALYAFYLELFTLAAVALIGLWHALRDRRLWQPGLISAGGIALLVLPWFAQPRLYGSSYAPTAGPVNLHWGFQAFVFGETLPLPWGAQPLESGAGWAAWIAITLIAAALGYLIGKGENRLALVAGLIAFVPLLLLSALEIATGSGYFRPRYVASAAPGWALMLALSLARLLDEPSTLARTGAALLGLGLAGLSFFGYWTYRNDPAFAKAPDWPGLAYELEKLAGPEDLILFAYPDPGLLYYYDGSAEMRIVPDGLDESALRDQLAEYRRLWFLPLAGTGSATEGWLAANTLRITSAEGAGLVFSGWDSFETIPAELDADTGIVFDELAALRGLAIEPATHSPGEMMIVELAWEPLGQSGNPLTVFVQLIGPPRPDGSVVWAQDDHTPQRRLGSTQNWKAGSLLRDVYSFRLPAEMLPGAYQIVIGFYDPSTGQRVEAISGGQIVAPGAVQIGGFTLN